MEQVVVFFLGIIGNKLCSVLWELGGTDIAEYFGNCREKIV